MTTLMMPSDYGVEMFLGSSPVLTSGYLASQPFMHDYPRLTPLQSPAPLQTTPTSLHSFWGGAGGGGLGGSCSSVMVNSSSNNNNNNNNYNGHNNNSSFRGSLLDGCLAPSLNIAPNYNNGVGSRNTAVRSSGRRVQTKKKLEGLSLQPIKSCLVARQEENELELGAVSPTRLKKKVVFADTQGHPLTEVRVLTERPDCPPRWTADFLEQVTGGAKAEAVADQWELAFPQPASDYLGMKARLEKDNVCLENAVVQEAENVITGTIKVRNLSFHKIVNVRYTTNNWASYDDVEATFVPSMAASASYDIYDTFSFNLPLPGSTQADKIEFCICYDADGCEFWDNNNSKNYVIVSFRPRTNVVEDSKPKDLYDVEIDSWSEFASWNHLSIDDAPYW